MGHGRDQLTIQAHVSLYEAWNGSVLILVCPFPTWTFYCLHSYHVESM